MDCNITYIFRDGKDSLLAEFTFMFGLTNIGCVARIAGKLYSVQEVVEEIMNGNSLVNITLREENYYYK